MPNKRITEMDCANTEQRPTGAEEGVSRCP